MLEIELEEKTPEEEAVRKNYTHKKLKIKNKQWKFQEKSNVWTALPISPPRSSAESAETPKTPATDSPNKTRAKYCIFDDEKSLKIDSFHKKKTNLQDFKFQSKNSRPVVSNECLLAQR